MVNNGHYAETAQLLVRCAILGVFSYFTVKWMINAIDPTRKRKKEAQEKVKQKKIIK